MNPWDSTEKHWCCRKLHCAYSLLLKELTFQSFCCLSGHILCLITHWPFSTPTLLASHSGHRGLGQEGRVHLSHGYAIHWLVSGHKFLDAKKRSWQYFHPLTFLPEIWREVANWQHTEMQKGDTKWGLECYVPQKQSEIWGHGHHGRLESPFSCRCQETQLKLVYEKKCNCFKTEKSMSSPGPSLSLSGGSTLPHLASFQDTTWW